MPHAFFLSPHLDDVAFSCGGALARLLAASWDATVATPFAASVEDPTGFALACQTDKGLSPEVDYMALRRDEDDAFAEAMRAGRPGQLRLAHGPFEEAPHRGYESPDALFTAVQPGDDVWKPLGDWLQALLGDQPADVLFAPQALGGHVDHVHAARAVEALGETAPPVLWYRDLPYALREPEAEPCFWVPARAGEHAVVLEEEALEAKLRGAAAYASQIGFQFGDEAALRTALSDFARAEGRRLGAGGAAEGVLLARSEAISSMPDAFFAPATEGT